MNTLKTSNEYIKIERNPHQHKLKDWEASRDWLIQISKALEINSIDIRKLKSLNTDRELHYHLKDGKDLCCLAGKLALDRIPDGIIYATSNTPMLEEKNIKLFLDTVEKELGIRKLFGSKEEKVFKNLEDFPAVLRGLSRLSKHGKCRSKVRPFDVKGTKIEIGKKMIFISLLHFTYVSFDINLI